ncbi:hypothetical protein HPL003_23150 [Paenibacillus terrae HPL-003]|uniref:Uncharacterized protein n=1 Tax=Paenibacillus terrae (strain HPL-003) TaxID=985665 RepID=G7VRH1_PAETH|nr:hypothetical protein [Paenibacillus terrae]AET61350.1 hypothetical protein HPL003_23150 [Paenibacillus terrae HPL-003]
MDTEFSKSEAPFKGVDHPHGDIGGSTGIFGTSSNKSSSSKTPNAPAGVWKVGRLSMGLFLVLLGGVTFASKFWGAGILDQALTWWPIVFVLLGLEILMYTAWQGTRERIRYDLFSMFITAVLVFCCIGFALVSSLGLTSQVRDMMSSVQETRLLPDWHEKMPAGVTKIIVQGEDPYAVKIDATTSPEVHVFGSYVYTGNEDELKGQEMYQTKHIGDTLYVLLGQIPTRFMQPQHQLDVTIAVPEGITVTVRDNQGNVIEK